MVSGGKKRNCRDLNLHNKIFLMVGIWLCKMKMELLLSVVKRAGIQSVSQGSFGWTRVACLLVESVSLDLCGQSLSVQSVSLVFTQGSFGWTHVVCFYRVRVSLICVESACTRQ